tara:strand:+ start:333 stop:722 length:390 start_codon:yes stop_codon:yes gene_type:complete
MTTFKSPEVLINKSGENIFKKLSNLNNLKDILPKEIEGFKSTEDTCSFKIQNMPKIKLEIAERIPFSKISLIAKESQIPFSLDCHILEKNNQCQVRLEIKTELNMMMKMMLEKPLTQFLDVLATKMKNI